MRRAAVSIFLWIVFVASIIYFLTRPEVGLSSKYWDTAADPHTFMSDSAIHFIHRYATAQYVFAFLFPLYNVILLWEFYACGVLTRIHKLAAGRISAGWLAQVISIVLAFLLISLLQIPLQYVHYRVQLAFGVKQSLADWAGQAAGSLGMEGLTILPAVLLIWWMIHYRRRMWWLKLWLAGMPIILFYQLVQPVLIEPLYHHLQPIPHSVIAGDIRELRPQIPFPEVRLYESRVSNQTDAINAYTAGIGSYARIVIWDTSLKELNQNELLSMIGHETGHYVHHDIYIRTLGALAGPFILLWLLYILWKRLIYPGRGAEAAGQTGHPERVLNRLPLLMLAAALLIFLSSPIDSMLSRTMENRADHYSTEMLGNKKANIELFQTIAKDNLNEISPPWLYQFFYGDHPTLLKRISENFQDA